MSSSEENYLNHKLRVEGLVSVNDVYNELSAQTFDLDCTDYGTFAKQMNQAVEILAMLKELYPGPKSHQNRVNMAFQDGLITSNEYQFLFQLPSPPQISESNADLYLIVRDNIKRRQNNG